MRSPWPIPAKMNPAGFEYHAKCSHDVFYAAYHWGRRFCALYKHSAMRWRTVYIFLRLQMEKGNFTCINNLEWHTFNQWKKKWAALEVQWPVTQLSWEIPKQKILFSKPNLQFQLISSFLSADWGLDESLAPLQYHNAIDTWENHMICAQLNVSRKQPHSIIFSEEFHLHSCIIPKRANCYITSIK